VAASETEIIDRFFTHLGAMRGDVRLGIGDDAAIVTPPRGVELVMTTDALVEGVHFLTGAPPRSLGHRALAVNLSDVAAMGAVPSWALLALTLPEVRTDWLADFAAGFGELARLHRVNLIGGNLSRGPLTITVMLTGFLSSGTALRRSGAAADDGIYVSGTLGDAAAALALTDGKLSAATEPAQWLRRRFEFPTPRVALGQAVRGFASACIDVSDGLYADLGRILGASGCGAVIEVDALPISDALRTAAGDSAWRWALGGGEDYELCCTVPPGRSAVLAGALLDIRGSLTRIGWVRREPGIELRRGDTVIQFSHSGFEHFQT
jgi:thiamine-monophosphate kinase